MDRQERAELIQNLLKHPGWIIYQKYKEDCEGQIYNELAQLDKTLSIESVRLKQGKLAILHVLDKKIQEWVKEGKGE